MKRLVLELTPKPFRDLTDATIESVLVTILHQWQPLIDEAESLSFLFWTADGSEILDYKGDLNHPIEWARYIGVANPPDEYPEDPKRQSIAAWPRLYTEQPATLTYRDLQRLVRHFRTRASELTGKPVSIGAIFDPGPEFAKSPFKYTRHPEIAPGGTMGHGTWVSCGATLHGDSEFYAGFPNGIAEGTRLGTFLGRQCQQFLTDMAFDYIWLSNGFGFALNAWHVTGEIFDGTQFFPGKTGKNRTAILQFWKDFRKECPEFPIATRGSNFSTAMDLASDGSPLEEIYQGGFNLLAPPNSPWAAMDGDYGLEIVGYLSHIATLPGNEKITFRYYLHDPWFLNSPWLDRYGREPHDIYMPLALARLDAHGHVTPVDTISFLTIDNSLGELVSQCPLEVAPHFHQALQHQPDAPGRLVWIYPFHEYHEQTFGLNPQLNKVFFDDWFMRGAINHGFPLNTVISTDNYLTTEQTAPERFNDSILVTPVPQAGSAVEAALLSRLNRGGKVLLYGPVEHASVRLLNALNLNLVTALEGTFTLHSTLTADTLQEGQFSSQLQHQSATSGGGIDTQLQKIATPNWRQLASVQHSTGETRAYAIERRYPSGGMLVWVRGTFGATITDAKLPVPCNEKESFHSERLMRQVLSSFDLNIRVSKPTLETRDPIFLTAPHRNSQFFSGYSHSTHASWKFRFPEGAPLLIGCDAWMENGFAHYHLPRAWHRECRCWINQETDGPVSCVEQWSGEVGIHRRLLIKGLVNATVRFYLEPDTDTQRLRFAPNDPWPYVSPSIHFSLSSDKRYADVTGITGSLLVSW